MVVLSRPSRLFGFYVFNKGVPMSQLTEIFLSLSQLRKVQLQFKEKCNSVQLHISVRKVQLHFFNRKVQLKAHFCK
jgi:hypothetical protein